MKPCIFHQATDRSGHAGEPEKDLINFQCLEKYKKSVKSGVFMVHFGALTKEFIL